jgi:CubicO group peptidase (beta-lactamase class C family)
MMRYWRWSAGSVIVTPLLAVSVMCGAQPLGGPATSEPPTATASSAVPRARALWHNARLNGGVWHGRRILDADYITQASTNQVPELEGKIRGYGYLWWITPLVTHRAYSAQGRYGQLITVVPDLRAVIVISSRASDDAPSIEDHLAMMDAAIVPGVS